MNKKDLHKIIKEELDKIRSEADTKVDDQGYAGDYYHVISDIIETWADEQTITNDIKGFLKAAFDTRGGSKAGDTKKGGEQLTRMVINAILKGIQEYRKSEPKDYMREEKADKDHDGDGKIESPEAEYKGSVDKAIKKNMKEEDETSFLNKSDFDVEKLDASDLVEYDLVLDDLMAVIKKYKWIKNLDKSVIAKQVLHDKKLVGDAIKKQKERRAIRKDYTPKPGRLKEAPTVYGEKEAIKMIWEDPGGKIESALKKISGYESVVQGASDKELYIYFTNKSAAMKGAMLLQHLVPGPEYKIRSEVDSYSIGIKA